MATCEQCGGIGLVRKQVCERWVSSVCSCQAAAAAAARIRRIQIPAGFEEATLESFQPSRQTGAALLLARRYVEEFPPAKNRAGGLLFTGSVGGGKTHLAVGIAQALAGRGFQPLFVHMGSLLEQIKRTFDREAQQSQGQILEPVWKADLVVLDELGAQRPTDWIFEFQELLMGTLYNELRPVIVTSNFPNLAVGGGENGGNEYQRATRTETLGDRIGSRMWSRLQQMCRHVDLGNGPDWRTKRP